MPRGGKSGNVDAKEAAKEGSRIRKNSSRSRTASSSDVITKIELTSLSHEQMVEALGRFQLVPNQAQAMRIVYNFSAVIRFLWDILKIINLIKSWQCLTNMKVAMISYLEK